jgi:hypothetical protein
VNAAKIAPGGGIDWHQADAEYCTNSLMVMRLDAIGRAKGFVLAA